MPPVVEINLTASAEIDPPVMPTAWRVTLSLAVELTPAILTVPFVTKLISFGADAEKPETLFAAAFRLISPDVTVAVSKPPEIFPLPP